jgi:hypothetical protein
VTRHRRPRHRPVRRGVFPGRKLSDEQEREVTRLYAETATPLGEIGQRFGIGHTLVARIAQRRGAALRSPSISSALASDRQGSAASADTGRAIESETNPTQPEPAAAPVASATRVNHRVAAVMDGWCGQR